MRIIPQYIIQLLRVYRRSIFYLLKKTILNFFFQLTKMDTLVCNMNFILEKHNSYMTYFVAAYLLEGHPKRVDIFQNSKHIALPHGYMHLNLQELPLYEAIREIARSKEIFNEFDLESWCFRAPYAVNSINDLGMDKFYQVLSEENFLCSTSEFKDIPPWKPIQRRITEYVIARPSDDLLIDKLGIWDPKVIAKECIKSIRKVKGSLLIFDMHPLRMGQKKFINALEAICQFVNNDPNSILIDFKNAIHSYEEGQEKNFVCITGDIDTWTYFDYIRRLKKLH